MDAEQRTTASVAQASPGGETDLGPGGHRYNDDLLLAQASRDRASREFPTVFHVLDHEELRGAFRTDNDIANRAKRQSHVAGFWAVIAAFAALSSASIEPLWRHLFSPWPQVIAVIAASLGLTSFCLAAIVLVYGKRKSNWLHTRLYTERLRQFHFQSFLWRLPQIAVSLKDENARNDYRRKREEWFKTYRDNFDPGAQLAAILNPAALAPIWLHPHPISEEPPVQVGDLEDLFRAYETFRFAEQEGYAEYMLRQLNPPEPAGSTGPRRRRLLWLWYPGVDEPLKVKRKILGILFTSAFATLVVMHVGILLSHLSNWHLFESAWPHLTIVLAALLAVAAKTLSEGFALDREIERFEEYRALVSSLRRAFREAASTDRKVRIMVEMEKASFEEMRMFLRSNYEAAFLM